MQSMPSCDELDISYQALRDLIFHPEFQRALEEIQYMSPIEGLQATFTQLTPEALRARGVPVPNDCTITIQASQDYAGSSSSTDDVAATEQASANGSPIQTHTRVCVGICPACICWNFAPVRRSDSSD